MDRVDLVDAIQFVRDAAEDTFRSIPDQVEGATDHELTFVRAYLEMVITGAEVILIYLGKGS